jgi:predicted AlkP superfamily phosphohydrolase/phosphomutase
MNENGTESKVVIVGLDGATMRLITPWVEQGKLPNLGRMMKTGVSGILRSTIPYITTTAWSSFATGLNPGKHGILDFYQHTPGSFDIYFTNAGVRRGKTLWRRVSEQGKKVCVINVPMTYPPEELDGVVISGMDSPGTDSPFTSPGNVYQDLKEQLGEYIIDLHFDEITDGAAPELQHYRAYLDKLLQMVENRCRATEYLMQKYPWELLVTAFMAPDRIQHQLWKFMASEHPDDKRKEAEELGDAICKVYQKCDEALGRILDKIDDDTSLMIMSDHGAGSGERVFYVRSWLRDNGFLALNDSAGSGFNMKKGAVSAAKLMFATAKKILPNKIKQQLKSRAGRDKYIAMRLYFGVNWEKTKAYSEGVCGNIFINMEGREPHGIVAPGEQYEQTCREITERLMEQTDPKTGNKVVRKVYRKEELFSGPFLDHAPDLLVEGHDQYHCRGDSFSKESDVSGIEALFSDSPLSGIHRIDGSFLAVGPHFKKGCSIAGAEIIDLAPTALHLLGMEIPETIDGKVLTDAFEDDFIRNHPVRRTKEDIDTEEISGSDIYSSSEKELIEERLRGLGYIE